MSYNDKKIQIDLLQQKINNHGVLSDELKRKINYKFRLNWNYFSNSMEGNTLTMDETRSVMIGNLTVGGKPLKDILEIKGHDKIVSKILNIGKAKVRLSETRIKEIHLGIMHEEDESKKQDIGKWKTVPNYMYNYKGERFDFSSPDEVPTLMHELLNKTNAAIDDIISNKKTNLHPIDIALQFHVDFVRIHPFYDGNGRTARILTNLLLISFGYPPFWINTQEKKIYQQYLGDIQGYDGDPNLFFDFIANLIFRSQSLILDVLENKETTDNEDIDKEIALLKTELSKENILTTKADVNNIAEAIEQNIFPVFKMIEEKCNQFKDFFFDNERKILFQIAGENVMQQVQSNSTFWESINSEWLKNQIVLPAKLISLLYYDYRLEGFKKIISAHSVYLNIEIRFNEYNYSIAAVNNGGLTFTFAYGKKNSQHELQKIAEPFIKDVIEQIKLIK